MKALNLFFITALLTLSSFAVKSDTDFSYMTLQGIETVAVRIESFDKDLSSYGFKENDLKKSLETKLSQAGFKIIPNSEIVNDDTASLVRLKFSNIKSGYGLYHYGVNLVVKEKIPLPRRENAFISATIWESNVNGAMKYHEVHKLKKAVDELIDRLIEKHRVQNNK